MSFTDNKKWHNIFIAMCCIIIISGIAIFITSPENKMFVGTCGPDSIPMTYSTDIQPTFEESFLHVFGEREPDRNSTLPPMQRYPDRKALIDTLMEKAGISASSDSVIGIYEFNDARLLLIDGNTSVKEVLESGDNVQTFSLNPVEIGSQHHEYNQTENPRLGAYNFSSGHSIIISRVNLVLPQSGNVTAPMYIVNKTDFEQDFYPDGRSLASITTRGIFYVIYGQRVERVIGSHTVLLDPAWKQCSPRMEISGEGSSAGGMKYTVKLARSSERVLLSNLITTSAHIQVYDATMGGGGRSQWMSTDSTGCTC
jgi:hypothetical protein